MDPLINREFVYQLKENKLILVINLSEHQMKVLEIDNHIFASQFLFTTTTWDFIGLQLVKLPRSPTVDDILKKYLEHRAKKDGKWVFYYARFACALVQ